MTAEKVGNHDVMFSPSCFALAESCTSLYFSSLDLEGSGSAIPEAPSAFLMTVY